jgi:hypothetical protein
MVGMRMLRYPVKVMDSLLDRMVAVLGAVGGSQLPGFIQHYTQRLGGHVAEAERNMASWQEIANGITQGDVAELANIYLLSTNPEVIAAGSKCAADLTRAAELREALAALQDASVWGRPFAFLGNFDREIAEATLASFSPNVPLDLEGIVYAACGLVMGIVIYLGVKQTCLLPAKRRSRPMTN